MELTMPYSWEFLKQFHFSNPPHTAFNRTEDVERSYMLHGAEIKTRGGVEPYLKKKYLSSEVKFNMTRNNFPYDMQEGIVHYVIWFKLESFADFNNPIEVGKIIQKFKEDNSLDIQDTVFFQNIERLRSVPGIPHIHVFVKLA